MHHLPSGAILLPSLLFAFGGHTIHAEEFALRDAPGTSLDILQNDRIIARYVYKHDVSTPAARLEAYKPYLHVFDAGGHAPITKGAGGYSTHHRGIFIGWNKISANGKSYDRWHMQGGDQIHEKFLAQSATKDRATFTSLVRWTGGTQDSTLIEEERTLTVLPAPPPGYALIEMTSKLKAVAGETVLGGDPEHAGLHFRPADEIERSATTYLYPRENAAPHKDRDYPWFGESFTVGGNRYSVIYLNHSSNPKGAAISAYRDYGRFGAYFSMTIPAGGAQTIRARFLIVAGEFPTAEMIQQAWNEYADASEPTPRTTVKPAEVGK